MRDLRAKLRQQEDNEPILWNPAGGDILVGTIGGDSYLAADSDTPPIVSVQEERTGIEVFVSLESPQLAALFELHRPRPGERIGIKCVSCSSAGERQFIVVMDRNASTTVPEPPRGICAQPQPADDDDWETATPEERDYIEKMLWGEPTETQAPRSREVHPSRRIEGMIGRGLDELEHQTRAVERLQALIVHPAPHCPPQEDLVGAEPHSETGLTEEAPDQPLATVTAALPITESPRSKPTWLGVVTVGLALMSAAGLVAGYLYLNHLIR